MSVWDGCAMQRLEVLPLFRADTELLISVYRFRLNCSSNRLEPKGHKFAARSLSSTHGLTRRPILPLFWLHSHTFLMAGALLTPAARLYSCSIVLFVLTGQTEVFIYKRNFDEMQTVMFQHLKVYTNMYIFCCFGV